MDPKKWIGKSHESAFHAEPEIIQNFEENMGRSDLVIEAGDKLSLYSHWLYSHEPASPLGELLSAVSETGRCYWHSGVIQRERHLHAGDKCRRITRIQDITESGSSPSSRLITLTHRIISSGKTAITEEQTILQTDSIEAHENPRRINFDPDWQQDAESQQLQPLRKLSSSMAGSPVSGFLVQSGKKENQLIHIEGSPALILLLESFNYHFESRESARASYQSSSFLPKSDNSDAGISIAGEDSDSFVTSLRIVNRRKQVHFGVDIRWNYLWSS